MRHFDVIVVGGGPAGSTCAYELAKAGVDVAIFDHSHPREKPCGGGLPRRFFNDFVIPKGVKRRSIDWIIVEDQNGNRVNLYQKFGGVTIMRREFDHALFKKAELMGTHCLREEVISLEENDGWIVKTNKGKYKSSVLIGADGCRSIVREYVIGDIDKENLAHAVGYHIPHNRTHINKRFGNVIELYFLSKPYITGGYIWIFPKMDFVTVGLMSKLGTKNIANSLEIFIKKHHASSRIVIPKQLSLHSHLVPFISSSKFYNLKTAGDNWMLIGDAAGHVNPLTGEGIYYAMMGGKLAAKAYLKGDVKIYDNFWRNVYGSDLYWGTRIQNIFYKPKILTMILKIGQRSPTMRHLLADIIASRSYYSEIFNRGLLLRIIKSFIEAVFNPS